jgi:hypothetical protein
MGSGFLQCRSGALGWCYRVALSFEFQFFISSWDQGRFR